MSYDLGCFYTSKPLTKAEAVECYVDFCNEGDNSDLKESSPRVADFVRDLTRKYPRPEDEDTVEGYYDCPWAALLNVSEGFVIMPIVYPRADELREFIVELAKKHGLVCFNPQSGKILAAPKGILSTSSSPKIKRKKPASKGPVATFSKILNDLLTGVGFVRNGRVWRKSGDRVVLAVRLVNDEGVYEVGMCAWFRERGSIEPDEVDPFGEYHLIRDLSEFPDLVEGERFQRAVNFTWDTAEDPPILSYGDVSEEVVERVIQAMEIDVPLTMEWRAAVLRKIMLEHGIPFLKEVESGDVVE